MLEKIKLVTATGDLVAYEAILPFNKPPEAILWGIRLFVLKDTKDPVKYTIDNEPPGGITTYMEVFFIPIPSPKFYLQQLAGNSLREEITPKQ